MISVTIAALFSESRSHTGLLYFMLLNKESSNLCTINTPIGQYCLLRLPCGISSASEVFQRSIAQKIEGLEGVVNIIDDLLVWGDTIEEHDQRLIL